MNIVTFENPGEVDIRALKTFGVNIKDSDNPIGFFGTGFKYAVSILLREKQEIIVQSGTSVYQFSTKEVEIRESTFNIITLNGVELGFTTDVGKEWELWMAYRELYSNCIDENGFIQAGQQATRPEKGITRIIVRGRDFHDVWLNRDSYILPEGTPIISTDAVDIYARESKFAFYRGIRIKEFSKPTKYTYNVKKYLKLTEDRTLKYEFEFSSLIAAGLSVTSEEDVVKDILTAPPEFEEHHFDYNWNTHNFYGTLKKVMSQCIQNRGIDINKTAIGVFRAKFSLNTLPIPCIISAEKTIILHKACSQLASIGFKVDIYPIIYVDDLGIDVLGLAKEGKIYIAERAFLIGDKAVAGVLLEEYIHLKHGYADFTRAFQNFLIDIIITLAETPAKELS